MRALHRLIARLRNFAGRRRSDERFREEMQSHLAALTEENLRRGMTREEAARRARLQFGSMELAREDCRAEQGLPFGEELWADARYALRVLRKSPAFTATALVILALGIGVNVVVFGVLHALLLRPLEVSDPQSLYQIRNQPKMSGGLLTASYPAFADFRERSTTFSGLTAVNGYAEAALRWRAAVVKVRGYEVAGNYFDLLGVQPALGRFFHAADERGPGSMPFVVLSDALWRRVFEADPAVIGATVNLNEQPFTVLGVAGARFHGTERFEWPDYWLPLMNQEQVAGWDSLQSRSSPTVTMLGRLKKGVTPQQAAEELSGIAAALAQEHPRTDRGVPMRLIRPGLFGDDGEVIRRFLYGVMGLTVLLLAAACANLASLFGARAADRSRELALRAALGSSRARLVRQLFTEALVVSVLGGIAALAGASLLLGALNRWRPSFAYGGQSLALNAEMDFRVGLAGLAFTLGSALLFGMIPAWRASQGNPLRMIKGGPAGATGGRRFAFRDLLLAMQIVICALLVTASLVALRGMAQALQTPLGIDPQGVMLAEMDLRHARQPGDVTLKRQQAMLEAVQNLPGVTAAGVVRNTPMGGGKRLTPVYREGTTEFLSDNYALGTRVYPMSPGYLQAAGTRLLHGRDVSWHDTATTPPVAIVNETFARKMWGQTTPIGQRFLLSGRLVEVVGVTEDGKYHDLMESPQAAVYLPLPQNVNSEAVLVVRSRLAPGAIAGALRRTLQELEPNVPIALRSWPDALGHVLFPARSATLVLGFIGIMAAVLAVTGIFGVTAYAVSSRKKELGIRLALGARPMAIMRAAMGRTLLLLGAGSAAGLLAGIFSSSLLGRMVYLAEPASPAVLVGVVATMTLIGGVGAAIPARRALAVDPSRLMREP